MNKLNYGEQHTLTKLREAAMDRGLENVFDQMLVERCDVMYSDGVFYDRESGYESRGLCTQQEMEAIASLRRGVLRPDMTEAELLAVVQSQPDVVKMARKLVRVSDAEANRLFKVGMQCAAEVDMAMADLRYQRDMLKANGVEPVGDEPMEVQLSPVDLLPQAEASLMETVDEDPVVLGKEVEDVLEGASNGHDADRVAEVTPLTREQVEELADATDSLPEEEEQPQVEAHRNEEPKQPAQDRGTARGAASYWVDAGVCEGGAGVPMVGKSVQDRNTVEANEYAKIRGFLPGENSPWRASYGVDAMMAGIAAVLFDKSAAPVTVAAAMRPHVPRDKGMRQGQEQASLMQAATSLFNHWHGRCDAIRGVSDETRNMWLAELRRICQVRFDRTYGGAE